jgi:hypothetical protein
MRTIWPSLFSVSQLLLLLGLQGCVAPLAAISGSGTDVASSDGTTVATAAVANPVTASSIASTATTGKSPLEHAASAATKKECNFLNVVGAKPICQDIVLPKVTDNSSPLSGPADQAQDIIKQ